MLDCDFRRLKENNENVVTVAFPHKNSSVWKPVCLTYNIFLSGDHNEISLIHLLYRRDNNECWKCSRGPGPRLWFLLRGERKKKRGKRWVNRNSSPRERWMLSDIFPSNKFKRMFSKTDLISLKALSAIYFSFSVKKNIHWSRKHWSWSAILTTQTPPPSIII